MKASKQKSLDVTCIGLIGRKCRSQYGSRDRDMTAIHLPLDGSIRIYEAEIHLER
jgi:hypothetical protein